MSDEEWQAIVDAANDEGEVLVYGINNPIVGERLTAAFAEDYPDITLTFVTMNPADIQARIEAELASGLIADVMEAANQSLIQQLSDDGSVVEPVGPAFSDPDYPFNETRVTPESFATFGSAYTWAWNTDLLPEGITSWDDYLTLEPGVLGFSDPTPAPPIIDYYKSVEEAAGEGFLDQIAAADLDPQIYASGPNTAAALGTGEIGAALSLSVSQVTSQIDAGAPLEFVVYEGSWLPTTWSMILNDSPHPNAAQVYANFVISPRGQQIIAGFNQIPFLRSIESVVPEGTNMRPLQNVPPEEAATFLERWNQLFG